MHAVQRADKDNRRDERSILPSANGGLQLPTACRSTRAPGWRNYTSATSLSGTPSTSPTPSRRVPLSRRPFPSTSSGPAPWRGASMSGMRRTTSPATSPKTRPPSRSRQRRRDSSSSRPPPAPQTSVFAEVGHERNGTFFPERSH